MRWYAIRVSYLNGKPIVVQEQGDFGGFAFTEWTVADIGSRVFTDEMMQARPDLREALGAWRAGDNSQLARYMAQDLLQQMFEDLEDPIGLLEDADAGRLLIEEYADQDPVCAKLVALRKNLREAMDLLGPRPEWPSYKAPDYEHDPAIRPLIEQARALFGIPEPENEPEPEPVVAST